MKATIAKRFSFDAAHFLPMVPDGHKCQRMHGHTYEVEFVLRGDVENGFVVDYSDISAAWAPIHETLDHRVLNDIEGLSEPSTENLAYWLFDRIVSDRRPELQKLRACLSIVRVHESSSTWCEMSAHDYASVY